MAAIGNQRFKDVLFAVGAASKFEAGLGRLQLQKFVYLTDVFSAVWRTVSKPPDFRPDQRGPYDPQIQNAVDALVFRGLIDVKDVTFRMQGVRANYQLAPIGAELIETLSLDPILHEEYELCGEIAAEVARRGWGELRSIVYAEPTYRAAKESGDSSRLKTNRPAMNQTLRLAQLFQASWEQSSEFPVTPPMFVQVMFLVFDEFRVERSIALEVSE